MNKISEVINRPVRTGVFFGAAETYVQFHEAFIKDLNEGQHVALLGMLTLVLNFVVVAIENKTEKALLRNVPPTKAPVVSNNPSTTSGPPTTGEEPY